LKPLKPIDYALISEFLKDSSRSDRQIAKALGVSQPTVTRRRRMLEQSCFDGYTTVPKLGEIGFELAALTFLRTKPEAKADEAKMRDWFLKQPCVIAAQEGRGLGYDCISVSLHRSYTEYAEFTRNLENGLADVVSASEAFLLDLKPGAAAKPFHLKYLADLKTK